MKRIFHRNEPTGAAHLAPARLQIVPDMGEQHGIDIVEQAVAHLESLARQQLLGNTGPSINVPGRPSFCISSFSASAAAMFTACPELWPSPWPGPPSTNGS